MVKQITKDINIAKIIYKHLQEHTLDSDEEQLLKRWLENPKNKSFLEQIQTTDLLYNGLYEAPEIEKKWEFSCIKERVFKRRTYRLVKYIAVASIFALILLTPFLLSEYTSWEGSAHQTSTPKSTEGSAIIEAPQGDVFYIADSVKYIVSNKNKTIHHQENNTEKQDTISNDTKEKTDYYTLTTAQRGNISIELSDGTKVALNAKTVMKYPMQFNGAERVVSLKGEAFFNVSKDGRPFIVETNNTRIKVLGTKFNVKSLESGEHTTTLVEGRIQVNTDNEDSYTLVEGQQIHINTEGEVSVKKVDTYYYTAWRNNLFAFKQTELKDIMYAIADWYGVTCVFETDKIKHIKYTSMIYRYDNINNVLDVLNSLDEFHCEIKENKQLVIR